MIRPFRPRWGVGAVEGAGVGEEEGGRGGVVNSRCGGTAPAVDYGTSW
jgi:hypothetical protein